MIWQGLCHIKLFCHTKRSEVSKNTLHCHTELCVAKWSISKSLSYWAKRSIHKFQSLSKILWIFRIRSIWQYGFSLCANALCPKWQKWPNLSYWAFARKRSIHKFKVRICILKYGFSLVSLTQNDKSGVDFCTATPCKRLGCYGSKWQRKIKLKLTAHCLLMKISSPLKKVLSPKSLWNSAKKQKPSFMAFCVSKFKGKLDK